MPGELPGVLGEARGPQTPAWPNVWTPIIHPTDTVLTTPVEISF